MKTKKSNFMKEINGIETPLDLYEWNWVDLEWTLGNVYMRIVKQS